MESPQYSQILHRLCVKVTYEEPDLYLVGQSHIYEPHTLEIRLQKQKEAAPTGITYRDADQKLNEWQKLIPPGVEPGSRGSKPHIRTAILWNLPDVLLCFRAKTTRKEKEAAPHVPGKSPSPVLIRPATA